MEVSGEELGEPMRDVGSVWGPRADDSLSPSTTGFGAASFGLPSSARHPHQHHQHHEHSQQQPVPKDDAIPYFVGSAGLFDTDDHGNEHAPSPGLLGMRPSLSSQSPPVTSAVTAGLSGVSTLAEPYIPSSRLHVDMPQQQQQLPQQHFDDGHLHHEMATSSSSYEFGAGYEAAYSRTWGGTFPPQTTAEQAFAPMAGDEQLLDVPGDRALSPSTASISAGIEQPGFFASLLATESSTTLASESTQRTAAVSPPLAVPSLYTTPAGIW